MLIDITGSDTRMDAKNWTEPLNALSVKCATCGFPDIDAVPKPYDISQSRAKNSNDVALAHLGNFFVRPRVREILDIVCPGECSYHEPHFQKSDAPTGWLLAVPVNQIVTGEVLESISRCKAYGEPASAHPGSQYRHNEAARNWKNISPELGDIFKSKNWGSSVFGWDNSKAYNQWIVREFILSVRLYQLFKKLKIKGFYEARSDGDTLPTAEDKIWIAEQISRLELAGVDISPPARPSAADIRWFSQYLKNHASEKSLSAKAFTAEEKRHGIVIPKSIQKFLTKVGAQSFQNVDEEEGAVVTILPLDQWDFAEYRTDQLDSEEDIADEVDAIMFASTNYGDCYCFDISKPGPEPPVLKYLHEGLYFEPYTTGFIECLRRFATDTTPAPDE